MSTLDSSIVNVALPSIMQYFRVSLPTIEWVVMIYLMTISGLLLTFGRLSDIKGRRWVYVRGFVIFVVGSLLCATAAGAGWLIVARSFQAIGAAMLMACSPALVVDVFPARERGRALGMIGTAVASGLTVGPALGGLLIDLFSWRAIFFINLPIGILAVVAANRLLKGGPADAARTEPFDFPGAALLLLCLASLLLALTHLHTWGPGSWKVLSLAGAGTVSGAFLVRSELRSAHPIFEPSLLRLRLFILPLASAVILFAGLFFITFLLPFYLTHPAGLPVDRVGFMMVVPFLFLFFFSPLSGAVSDRIGSRWLCTAGMAGLAAAMFALANLQPAEPYFSVAWRLAMAGISIAVFLPPNSAAAMSSVPVEQRGIAAGSVATARNFGMAIGVAAAALIFNSTFHRLSGGLELRGYSPDLEPFFMGAYRQAMQTGGWIVLAGAVVAAARGREPRTRT
jgi:EmrB/QacA subfamily drug resistance transporter